MAGYLGNAPTAVPLSSADLLDGIITSAKIADGTIVNADINASAGIVTSKLSGALGITEADMWRITADLSQASNTIADITANWERVDTGNFGKIGTGMTESSGIFSFPSTGVYYIQFLQNMFTTSGAATYAGGLILVTTNNSTYNSTSETFDSFYATFAQGNALEYIFVNVTNVSNIKVKFQFRTGGATTTLEGNTGLNRTYAQFIRLGDSV